jgi:hypothetical protein
MPARIADDLVVGQWLKAYSTARSTAIAGLATMNGTLSEDLGDDGQGSLPTREPNFWRSGSTASAGERGERKKNGAASWRRYRLSRFMTPTCVVVGFDSAIILSDPSFKRRPDPLVYASCWPGLPALAAPGPSAQTDTMLPGVRLSWPRRSLQQPSVLRPVDGRPRACPRCGGRVDSTVARRHRQGPGHRPPHRLLNIYGIAVEQHLRR